VSGDHQEVIVKEQFRRIQSQSFMGKVVSFPVNSVANDKETAIFNTNTIDCHINKKTVLTKKVVTHATDVEKYRDNNLHSVTTTMQLAGDKCLQCYHHNATSGR